MTWELVCLSGKCVRWYCGWQEKCWESKKLSRCALDKKKFDNRFQEQLIETSTLMIKFLNLLLMIHKFLLNFYYFSHQHHLTSHPFQCGNTSINRSCAMRKKNFSGTFECLVVWNLEILVVKLQLFHRLYISSTLTQNEFVGIWNFDLILLKSTHRIIE